MLAGCVYIVTAVRYKVGYSGGTVLRQLVRIGP